MISQDSKNNLTKEIKNGCGYIMGTNGEPVILSQMRNTKVIHAQEQKVMGADGKQYNLISGYLEECRNPMFVLQKIAEPQ